MSEEVVRATQFAAAASLVPTSHATEARCTFVLTAIGVACVAEIYEGGSGGTLRLTLAAAVGTTSNPISFNIKDPYLHSITAGGLLTVLR